MKRVRLQAIVIGSFGLATLAGCASGSMASRGASAGAKQGALGGAVAGAVGSIFWGGNVVGNMAASAAIGAASGAAMGGASGASVDKEIAAKRQMSDQDAAVAQKLGPSNFEAAVALAECKHKKAVGLAKTAYGTVGDDERRRYALMIEAIADEESGDTAAASEVYPLLVRLEPSLGSVDRARSEALAGVLTIQRIRSEHGRAPTCG